MRGLPPSVRTLIHCVFHATEPHGDIYTKISPCVDGDVPVVPHIVRTREPHGPDMRAELGIPRGATVFGRHGGLETFSIDFARWAVVEVAAARPDVYFLFLNTYPMHEKRANIIYIERTSDEEAVARFIRTCDAMLHARDGGETFGLACAEFSAHQRPVLTSTAHDDDGRGRMHLDVLGAHAACRPFFYRDHASLVDLLMKFQRDHSRGDVHAYRAYEPRRVMATFERVFLGGKPGRGFISVLSAEERGLAPATTAADAAAPSATTSNAGSDEPAHVRREQQWAAACENGTVHLEALGCVGLPGENGVFLSCCRWPLPRGHTSTGGSAEGDGGLLHVFRSDALATFADSAIRAAYQPAYSRVPTDILSEVETAVKCDSRRLSTGEDPRVFMHAGRVYVVDNTLDACRLIELDHAKLRGGVTQAARVYRVALSGKNLTFLPAADDGGGGDGPPELLLVHWFVPLRVYRVGLPEELEEPYATLECIFAQGEHDEHIPHGSMEGAHGERRASSHVPAVHTPIAVGDVEPMAAGAVEPIVVGDVAQIGRGAPPDDEYRGGTPGRPAGRGVWWGLLHRTHMQGGRLVHDPYAWCVRRHSCGLAHGHGFVARLTPVEVRGRPLSSCVLDPCSIFECSNFEGMRRRARERRRSSAGEEAACTRSVRNGDDDDDQPDSEEESEELALLVTTAESEKGWFEPQAFRTGVWRLVV